MVHCKYCNTDKPETEFYDDNHSKCKDCVYIYNKERIERLKAEDPEKVKEYNRVQMRKHRLDPEVRAKDREYSLKYVARNRDSELEYATTRQKERQQLLNKLKSVPCVDCGNSFPPCAMDFDHVRGEKFNNISLMKSYSLKRLMKEVAKCDIVCANCHRIRTYKRKGSDESLTTFKPLLIQSGAVSLHQSLFPLTLASERGTKWSNPS